MQEKRMLSPFSAEFWKQAAAEFHNVRTLAFTAVLMAASIVISSLFIPVGENLRIYFTFVVKGLMGMVAGPLLGLAAGAATDLLSFFIHPSGPFFIGYTISEMLGVFVFAMFLYRQKCNLWRLIVCRVINNYAVNVALGSCWSAILYGKGYFYYLAKSLVKNTLMLPIEVIILLVLFRLLMPEMAKMGLIPAQSWRKKQ
ncbi:folate family ECF transporter S component [Acidaminobacterium chupaoyuni]